MVDVKAIQAAIREFGFDMFLSGQVPNVIAQGLPSVASTILDGRPSDAMRPAST